MMKTSKDQERASLHTLAERGMGTVLDERSRRARSLGRGLLVLGCVFVTSVLAFDVAAVGTRHFVLEKGGDFESGELEGAAVDSLGVVRSGLDLGKLEVPEADSVWSSHRDGGDLYLGTGNEGKLLRLRAGKVEELAQVEALALTSMTRAFGRLVIGAMPGGKLYEWDGTTLKEFARLDGGDHVWALSYDERARALYVATGPDGKLFRVSQDGTAQVYFDAPEEHLVSVLVGDGEVLAGSGEEARLYSVTGPGRARVLHDFAATEVRSVVASSLGLMAIVNELKAAGARGKVDKTKPGTPTRGGSKGGSGQLFLFRDGSPELLYESEDEHFVALSTDDDGAALVGTGAEGRIIRVEPDHRFAVLADLEERQAVFVDLAGNVVVGNDPITVHPIASAARANATWTGEVLDAGIRARFGRVSWTGSGKFVVETRSGNTKEPEETWSDWELVSSNGAAVASPPARFLQLRLRLQSKDAQLTRIDVPYITDNLRPVVTSIEAKSSAVTSGSTGVEASGGPRDGSASSKIRLSWKVDNPDKDELRYSVEIAPEGTDAWQDALDPGTVLTKSDWDWNTEHLPEGRYRVRVTASDELSNPPDRVKRHQMLSEVVLVDNTAPRLSGLRVQGQRLVGKAQDGVGPLQRFELKGAGQQVWIPFEPEDGIFDQATEAFSLDLGPLRYPAGTLVTVRVYDMAGNAAVEHVRLP